jgi:hypothetical protein
VDTFIGQGVTIEAPTANVRVETQYTANALAFTISISVGGVAVGATLALAINMLDANTYIGASPDGSAEPGSTAAIRAKLRPTASLSTALSRCDQGAGLWRCGRRRSRLTASWRWASAA